MKRITITLPDSVAERLERAASGDVSAYVAAVLMDDLEPSESLDKILADWEAETPVPEEIKRWAEAELDRIGLYDRSQPQAG